jgi:branched-chain amino acid transport system permease protein
VLVPADLTVPRYALALVVSIAVLGALGVLLYFTAVRPFFGLGGMAWVMSTIGFGIILQNVALAIWGPGAIAVPSPLGDEVIRLAGAGIRPQELLVLGVAGAAMLALDHVLRRTRIGKAVRAVAANPDAASLMGINVGAVVVLAFVLSSGLAALAGVLIAPITTASVFMGLAISLKAFSAAIAGGLTNPRGCIAGGFLLGCTEALVGLWHAELREITVFGLIILVLALKPEGLFGRPPFEKV